MPDSAIVDTNLLILAIVGAIAPHKVGEVKRTTEYRPKDVPLLNGELKKFGKFLTLPNILTEASNLIGNGDSEICPGANRHLAEYASRTAEEYIDSGGVMTRPEFFRLGLTDAALLEVARRDVTIITTDWQLAGSLHKLKLRCVNFNNLRTPKDY